MQAIMAQDCNAVIIIARWLDEDVMLKTCDELFGDLNE